VLSEQAPSAGVIADAKDESAVSFYALYHAWDDQYLQFESEDKEARKKEAKL
jgi:hypothetical protein